MADDTSKPDLSGNNVSPSNQSPDALAAADIIRSKVSRAYAEEPAATQELAEAEELKQLSPHQKFMLDLSNSGKDLATIQTEWHNYYVNLADNQKHEVWQEFYASQSAVTRHQVAIKPPAQELAEHKNQAVASDKFSSVRSAKTTKVKDIRSTKDVQSAIRSKVSSDGQLKVKHHVQSVLFGLGMGALVVFIFLFGFFNEVFIAPFIQPSRVAAATPLIVNSSSVAPTTTPEVIIPKINVEIPVDYNETSTNENDIENDLQSGVVHYPTTVLPGEDGNTAFFGHSSNNILNKGKYKFAFVLLHTLVAGDTFYLTYNDKVYVYKVISRQIVDPSDVGVLSSVPGQIATATLITCDPPGTSLHRLVVVGQQISPDPSTNVAAAAPASTGPAPTSLPSNGPTLWTTFISKTSGKLITGTVILGGLVYIGRWVTKPKRAFGVS